MRSLLIRENQWTENKESKELDITEVKVQLRELTFPKEISAQEVAEKTYSNTIEQITKEFDRMIPEDQRIRIEKEKENYKPTVLSSENYLKRFPEADPGVLGHYDSDGRVYLKEGSSERVKHVTTHEALHLTSYKERDVDMDRSVYRCGIREVVNTRYGISEDNHQALNEGITELYAIREMQLQGERSSIEAVLSYTESRRKAYELQGIVGSEIIQKAYFGGDTESLRAEVNRLSFGDETAWDRYSKNVDTLEYGTDAKEIEKARKELTIQNAIMTSFLELESIAGKK